jgi:exodeoxyribonuclease VIII
MNTDFDYFKVPALSASLAKELLKSAAHGKYRLDNPMQPTASMQLGTAVHGLILEPHRQDIFVTRPADLDRRTKDGKARYAELEAAGLPILTQDEADTAYRMRDAVLAVRDVASALAHGNTEVPAFWDGRGTSCKAKADLVCGDVVLDVKTCVDASPRGFEKQIWSYRYFTQARHYMDAFDAKQFIFVAVESAAPYGVGVYDLSQNLLDRGDRDLDIAAARYQHGIRTGEWPGYNSEIQMIGETADF